MDGRDIFTIIWGLIASIGGLIAISMMIYNIIELFI